MKEHIKNFPKYLLEGYHIGKKGIFDISWDDFDTVLFVGMGGSGMTLSVIEKILENSPKGKPSAVIKDYTVPLWVNKKTLMIIVSYSGNTEETISAMKQGLSQGAYMIAITSGGVIKDFAMKEGHALAEIPTGIEPRAALPYSFGIQLALFEKLGCIEESIHSTLEYTAKQSKENDISIHKEMKYIAHKIAHHIPVIYTTSRFAPLALRARQQLNENSRMLCRDHLLPEMNHNELLARQKENKNTVVLRLDDPDMYIRNRKRVEITNEVLISKNTQIYTIKMNGKTYLEKICSTIYLIDRLSYYVSIERSVDTSEKEIIIHLKKKLKKFEEK